MFFIKKISFTNFRCYEKGSFDFFSGKNIIIGKNASGKTSLVEGIYCLCFTKSFKNVKDNGLVNKNKSFFNIKGEFENVNNSSVMISCDLNNKKITKDQKTYKNISEYVGFFNCVVFSPDDLSLIKGSPSERRKFLDVNISQIDKIYMENLISYKKILKERNEFLKSIENNEINNDLFEVLTEKLIEKANVLILKREAFINKLNEFISLIMNDISSKEEKLSIVYKPNCNVDNLWKTAKDNKKLDIITKTTNFGPSRDDFSILINNDEAQIYASQGQIRSAALSIKLGLVNLFKKYNSKTIIILDDVFSELDNNRQKQILNLLSKENQTFITTTSLEHLSEDVLKDSNIIKICGGKQDERE